MNNPIDLKETVKQKYSEIALQDKSANAASLLWSRRLLYGSV
jgi:hypothetical protein